MRTKDLSPLFGIVFGTKDPDVIGRAARDFDAAATEALAARPAELREKDARTDLFWPKDAVEYMFYADQLGADRKDGTFRSAAAQIPRLKRLGADLLYPLPFLRSAGLDGGFDVMDFFTVEPRLGGNEAFEHFVKEARAAGLRIKMDLVLNHFSDQHPWFQALLGGDLTCRDCFITRDAPPEIVRRESTPAGEVVTYRETGPDGKPAEVKRRLIFPDIARTHYREIRLPDGRPLWVYHTFYPFQLDLNYANPQVVREAYRIFAHWANRGIDVFRLDAIPFLDKTAENHPRTHAILALFSAFVKRFAPSSRLMVEACQPLGDIVAYFGRTSTEAPPALPAEAQMAYQFEGMACGWLSFVSGDGRFYDDYVRRLSALQTPGGAIWAQFLRVHDELTLEMVSVERKPVLQALFRDGRGLPFRDGNGVAGRMAAFLGDDRARIRLAFAWLMSQDGMPILYYGDEAAARNNPGFIDSEEAARTAYFRQAGMTALGTRDTRDLGRGPVSPVLLEDAEAGRGDSLASGVFSDLRELIRARKSSLALRRGSLRLAGGAETRVLAYWRECPEPAARLLVLLNLDGAPVQAPVPDAAGPFRDLITGGEVVPETRGGTPVFPLSPYGVLWLQPAQASASHCVSDRHLPNLDTAAISPGLDYDPKDGGHFARPARSRSGRLTTFCGETGYEATGGGRAFGVVRYPRCFSIVCESHPFQEFTRRKHAIVALFVLVVLLPAGAVPAAEDAMEHNIQVLLKDYLARRKEFVAANLPLAEGDVVNFWPVYEKYTAEMSSILDKRMALYKEYADSYATLTEEQAASILQRSVFAELSMVQLKQKYIPRFQKVISSKKTAIFFQLDREFALRLETFMVSKIPLVKL